MRRVFGSAEEVAAVWAERRQDEGRASRFFFRKGVISSYRSSFPVGIFFDGPDGTTFCLIEKYHPSNSTAKHCSLARHAAEDVRAKIIHIGGIHDFVDLSEKPKIGLLNKLREALEEVIEKNFEQADKHKDGTHVQSERLADIAHALKAHEALSESFALGWPKIASIEAVEARRNLNVRAARDTSAAKSEAAEKAQKDMRKRLQAERNTPMEPAAELAAWRRGERLGLHCQPQRDNWDRSVRCRIHDGRMETDTGHCMKSSDFSKMLLWAVKTVADADDIDEPQITLGSCYVNVDGAGTAFFGRHSINLDEMLEAAETGAPRIYARALEILPEEARAEFLENHAEPAPAP